MADKTYSVTAAMTPRQRFVHDYVERFLLYWGLECAKRGVPFRDDGQRHPKDGLLQRRDTVGRLPGPRDRTGLIAFVSKSEQSWSRTGNGARG